MAISPVTQYLNIVLHDQTEIKSKSEKIQCKIKLKYVLKLILKGKIFLKGRNLFSGQHSRSDTEESFLEMI